MNNGTLYIVATPIGNLEDITLRALRILKEVDMVACEDTRVTSKLLSHYSISKPLLSLHQHSGKGQYEKIISELKNGKSIAYCSDAGTPGISDPGNMLVEEALKNDIVIFPIPGASAIAALISVAGADMQRFIFMGFPPHKKGRETFFKKITQADMPVAYYESPHRVVKNLELFEKLLNETQSKEKNVIVGREMTKMFEQVIRFEVSDAVEYFKKNPEKIKGEFVVIIY